MSSPAPARRSAPTSWWRTASLVSLVLSACTAHQPESRVERAPTGPRVLSGRVLGEDGKPVAGALVAVIPAEPVLELLRAQALETTDAEGRFHFTLAPGRYTFSVTALGLTAGSSGLVTVESSNQAPAPEVKLGAEGFVLSGSVIGADGHMAPDAIVRALPYDDDTLGALYVRADTQGTYVIKLPPGRYGVLAEAPGQEMRPRGVRLQAYDGLHLQLRSQVHPTPPQEELLGWVREHALPVKSLELNAGGEDLEALRRVIGRARVVGVGESTHGTREFFQFRHRLFEFLVTRMGFTAFAIEAPWAGSLALNNYVLTGKGEPRALLADGPWTSDTEELLELLHWMRHYNEDPRHPRKLHFAGYTNGAPALAAEGVLDYLSEVEPSRVAEVRALVAPLTQRKQYWKDYAKLSPEQKQRLNEGLLALHQRLLENQSRYTARTGEARWRVALQQAWALVQVEADERPKSGMVRLRDAHMAENVQWLLEQEGADGGLVVAGHNGHITFQDLPGRPMGWYLRQSLGARYLALGSVFNQGQFVAIRQQATAPDRRLPRESFTVGPAPEQLLEHTLAQAQAPACVIDPREAPRALQDWFHVPWLTRDIGAAYHEDDAAYWTRTYPAEDYDALFFVDRSTPAHAIPRDDSAP